MTNDKTLAETEIGSQYRLKYNSDKIINKFSQEVLQHLPKYWLTLRFEICQIPKLQEEILIKLIHTLDFLFKKNEGCRKWDI